MDDRLRFLYCRAAEDAGTRARGAGRGRTDRRKRRGRRGANAPA